MSKKALKMEKRALPAPLQTAMPYLAAVVLFLALCLSVPGGIKVMAAVCTVLALAAAWTHREKVAGLVRLPLIMLGLVVLMDGISTLYAASGKFALYEYLKVFAAFGAAVILLAMTSGEGSAPGRKIAAVLTRGMALAGIVSIDALSTRLISTPVIALLNALTKNGFADLTYVEPGIRMTSLFLNPNTFAGCAGIAVLLGLGLALSAEKESERMSHVACLSINALAFVLAFSMGASGMIAAAFLVYLALEFRERRADLFLLMVETLAVTVVGMALVSKTSLQEWSGFQPIPMLCVIVGAAALCALDHFVGRSAAPKLAKHGKLLLGVIAGTLVLMVVFALAAYRVTGGVSLQAGEGLRRSIYPEAGTYTLVTEGHGITGVVIESQNRQDTMMHTSTVLYEGNLADAAFTVPEDSEVVYCNFFAIEDVSLNSIRYEGTAGSGSVPLGYKLLPGFVANRLQGLFANQNAIQRLVFFEDGMKLFHLSPVIGRGLGGFENGILSTQSFFYETKYAHNHYIQALAETGVIGFVLFVLLLLSCAAAILFARRRENAHPMLPALGAALVFMAGHAAVEVVFSANSYLILAFAVFALINMCCGDALPVPGKQIRVGAMVAASVLAAAYFCLLCGNMSAASKVNKMPTFDTMESAVKMDRFEWTDYALSYVVSAPMAGDNAYIRNTADRYADRLQQVDSNTIPLHLAQYYFVTGRTEQGFDMVKKFVSYVSSKSEAWQEAFALLEAYAQDDEAYRSGVQEIVQMMTTWNTENMGLIDLTEANWAFLNGMLGL